MNENLDFSDVTTKQEMHSTASEASDDNYSDKADEWCTDTDLSKPNQAYESGGKRKRVRILTPEQRRRESELQKVRRSSKTPEERERQLELRRKKYAEAQKRLKEMGCEDKPKKCTKPSRPQKRRILTPEERARELEKRREREARKKETERYDELRRKTLERRNLKLQQMTPEEREMHLAKRRLYHQEMLTKMTDEERKAHRMKKYFGKQAQIAKMSKEERQAMLKKNSEQVKKYMKNLPPEKKEIYRQKLKENTRRYLQKHTEKGPSNYTKVLEYVRKRTATETPEARQKRLRRYKINAARRKLKAQLEEEGLLSVEEIETMLTALVEQMKSEPLPPPKEQELSQYKPRPSGRKPKKKGKESGLPGSTATPQLSTHDSVSESSSEFRPPIIIEKFGTEIDGGQPEKQLMFANTQSFEDDAMVIEPPSCPPSPCFYENDEDFVPDNSDNDSIENEYMENEDPVQPMNESLCPHCDLDFTCSSEIQGRLDKNHTWKCPNCSEILRSYPLLRKHFKMRHSKESEVFKFVCMRCPWANDKRTNHFKSHRQLLRHVQHHHPSSYYPCPVCNLLLYSELRYESHFSVCSKSLTSKIQSSRSKKTNSIICDLCGKSFERELNYGIHVREVHHPDKTAFVCPICDRKCSATRSFWVHFVRCSKLIPRNVTESFYDALNPTMERRKRSKSKPECERPWNSGPIPCEHCGKTFTQKCTLDDHVRREHEGESNICSECNRNFQSAGKLWRHQAEVHNMTDLPPPPGVEVMRCKYCEDFVMRGYEMHVRKKHPESLEAFRELELPKVKALLAEVRKKNPSKMTKRSLSSIPAVSIKEKDGKSECPVCSVVITQGCMTRHMKTQHPTHPLFQTKGIKCSKCDMKFQRPDRFECHYAEIHAFEGIEAKLIQGTLLKHRNEIEADRNKKSGVSGSPMCLICNVELPASKLSIRVHFLAHHYKKLMELSEISS